MIITDKKELLKLCEGSHKKILVECDVCHKVPDEFKTKFEIYQYEVRKLTRSKKKKIFEEWNGYDYYDNEYIKDNFKLNYFHVSYPTIDHKTSIFFGFNNNISIEEIADVNNLCVTKRSIKRYKMWKLNFLYKNKC